MEVPFHHPHGGGESYVIRFLQDFFVNHLSKCESIPSLHFISVIPSLLQVKKRSIASSLCNNCLLIFFVIHHSEDESSLSLQSTVDHPFHDYDFEFPIFISLTKLQSVIQVLAQWHAIDFNPMSQPQEAVQVSTPQISSFQSNAGGGGTSFSFSDFNALSQTQEAVQVSPSQFSSFPARISPVTKMYNTTAQNHAVKSVSITFTAPQPLAVQPLVVLLVWNKAEKSQDNKSTTVPTYIPNNPSKDNNTLEYLDGNTTVQNRAVNSDSITFTAPHPLAVHLLWNNAEKTEYSKHYNTLEYLDGNNTQHADEVLFAEYRDLITYGKRDKTILNSKVDALNVENRAFRLSKTGPPYCRNIAPGADDNKKDISTMLSSEIS